MLSGVFEMLREHLPSSPRQFWVTAVCCIRRVGHRFCVVPTGGDSNYEDGGEEVISSAILVKPLSIYGN